MNIHQKTFLLKLNGRYFVTLYKILCDSKRQDPIWVACACSEKMLYEDRVRYRVYDYLLSTQEATYFSS